MASSEDQRLTLRAVMARHRWIATPFNVLDGILTPGQWPRLARTLRLSRRAAAAAPTDGVAVGLQHLTRPLWRLRATLIARNPALQRAFWRLRQAIWTIAWGLATVSHMRPKKLPVPGREAFMALIAAPQRHSDFRSSKLVAPLNLPLAERSLPEGLFVRFMHLLQDVYPVNFAHQPQARPDPVQRMSDAYPLVYRMVRSPPAWHPDLVEATASGTLLAALAAGGPFAKLLEHASTGDADYCIDLSFMANYPVREGLAPLGCRIDYMATDSALCVAAIHHGGVTAAPGDASWAMAERVALCSLLTHVTVWRHGMQYHMAGFAPVPVVTYNLPPDNPIRRLLTPHIFLTLPANYHTHLTLRRSGFDVTGLSFPRDVAFRYYDDGAKAFDLSRHDACLDLQRRGIAEALHYPYREQALRYYAIFESYVRAYVEHHYPDEAALGDDLHANIWFDALDRELLHGVRGFMPELTRDNLVRFCTTFIYAVTVEHEENTLWDYAVFLPATVRADGTGPTVGEVQSVMDFQLLISTQTNYLLDDNAHVALDSTAAAIMQRLQSDLRDLQAEMEAGPSRYWQLPPVTLKASVSA